MIYLHPASSTSPERIQTVQDAAGLIAVIQDREAILVSPSPAALTHTTPLATPVSAVGVFFTSTTGISHAD